MLKIACGNVSTRDPINDKSNLSVLYTPDPQCKQIMNIVQETLFLIHKFCKYALNIHRNVYIYGCAQCIVSSSAGVQACLGTI